MDRLDRSEPEQAEDVLELTEPAYDTPPAIGNDERRMHVRAYNYWASLLAGRPFPSVADLEAAKLQDFGPHSVLLDFTEDHTAPSIPFVGQALREEGGVSPEMKTIADVPSRSLLSRLTDHYFQIISNRAPIGFEAEFVNLRGNNTMYRGILMPLSSDGQAIDFVYGVINWKELAHEDVAAELAQELDLATEASPILPKPDKIWADGPRASSMTELLKARNARHDDEEIDGDDGVADRLYRARESAEAVKSADGRSRVALYQALSHSYDLYLAAEAEPETYANLLEDSGLTVQARAPMTPIVKLVFGIDYDKTRLTEFAAALSHAQRINLGQGELSAYLDSYQGGLKALVAAERAARRPADKPKADRAAEAREHLRAASPALRVALSAPGEEEFVLLVARRDGKDGLAILDSVPHNPALVDRALQAVACPAPSKAS